MRRFLSPVLLAVYFVSIPYAAPAGIQLSSFTATGTPSGVRLDWTTLTETNNFGFNIQRSLNAETDYQTVPNSFVGGAGTSGVPHTYAFTDTSAPGGTWYYRLQQVDLSGPVHYTNGVLAHRPFFGQFLPDSLTHLLLHCDETAGTVAHDLSPYRTHGVLTGAVPVAGRFGGAFAFSAAGHSVLVPDTASLRLPSFTIEAWVTSGSFAGMGPGVIVTKRRTAGSPSFVLRMSGTTGRVCFVTGAGAADSVRSSTVLQNGAWYHVAGFYDQNTVAIAVNGVVEASRPLSAPVPYDGSGVWVGQDSAGGARWQGTIDEVRLSSGVRAPQTFNLQLPPSGLTAAAAGNTVNLAWQNGGGGIGLLKYRVYRGTDSTALTLRDSSALPQYADTQPPANTLLYYRVTALDSTRFESRTGAAAAVLTPPAPPLLMFPLNGASGLLPPVALHWRVSPGTSAYRVQLSADSLFGTVLLDDSTVTDTMLTVSALAGPARYYWRVFARGAGGSSGPSALRRFDVAGAPGTVILAFPDAGAIIQQLQVTLRWLPPAPPVSGYWVEVADNALFTGSIIDSTVADTSLVFQPLQYGTRYWWRVRARNAQGWGSFSAVRTFDAAVVLQVPLSAGWNMISLPLQVREDSVVQVYPTSLAPHAFAFVPPQGYVQRYVLDVGTGYWAKFPAAISQAVAGAPVLRDSIPVSAGWNMIGSISTTVDTASVVSVPPGIRISSFFGYNGSLAPSPTLVAGKAYWVKTNAPGVLLLGGTGVQGREEKRRAR